MTSITASAITMPTRSEIQPKMRCFIGVPLHLLASWIACHTRCGVAGIWMLRTPSGHSASMIAFITVGVEPTAPDSPTPLAPSGLVLAGTLSSSALLKVGKVVGARHGVVHERAGDELAGFAIVDIFLEQRLADALGAAALDLAEHDRPMQRPADIVDGGVALELDEAGVGIDLDLADMRAVRPGDAVDRIRRSR